MGNRAVIAFGSPRNDQTIGIYVHWNGGRDSVEGFLQAARQIARVGDESYSLARLIEAIGLFFGGSNSVGVDLCRRLDCDNGNNGVYEVDPKTLEIIGRDYVPDTIKEHGEQREHDPKEIADFILKRRAAAEAVRDE